MIIFASEDIGNADPQALQIATAAAAAIDHVGMPEGQFALSQATIYLALAPKSKEACKAIGRARNHVREHGAATPPAALRSSGYPGAAKLGRGLDYDDPHGHPGPSPPKTSCPRRSAGRASTRPTSRRRAARSPRGIRAKRGLDRELRAVGRGRSPARVGWNTNATSWRSPATRRVMTTRRVPPKPVERTAKPPIRLG